MNWVWDRKGPSQMTSRKLTYFLIPSCQASDLAELPSPRGRPLPPAAYLSDVIKYFFLFFFKVGPHKEDIFLTTSYGLYFSSMLHMLQIAIWASEGSFHIAPSADFSCISPSNAFSCKQC